MRYMHIYIDVSQMVDITIKILEKYINIVFPYKKIVLNWAQHIIRAGNKIAENFSVGITNQLFNWSQMCQEMMNCWDVKKFNVGMLVE